MPVMLTYWQAIPPTADPEDPRPTSGSTIEDPDTVRDRLEQAGFTEVLVWPVGAKAPGRVFRDR